MENCHFCFTEFSKLTLNLHMCALIFLMRINLLTPSLPVPSLQRDSLPVARTYPVATTGLYSGTLEINVHCQLAA